MFFIFALFALWFMPVFADPPDNPIVATKSYADSIIAVILNHYDWAQTNPDKKDFIQNKPEFATVAVSGSYEDLTDKPTAAIDYEIKTNSLGGVATNGEVYVDMDGLRFLGRKMSTASDWAMRIKNNTGATVDLSTKLRGRAGGAVSARGEKNTALANGAELNPGSSSDNLGNGSGGDDYANAYVIDYSNARFYEFILAVRGGRAFVTVRKLH
jgi:hypothetical protein